MKIQAVLISSFIIGALSGCTTSDQRIINGLIESASCSQALSFARQNFSGLNFYFNVARVENECRNNRNKSIQLLELTAKYGHKDSIEYLESLGLPIPQLNPTPIPIVVVNVPSIPINVVKPNSAEPAKNTSTQSYNGPKAYLTDTQPIIGGALCSYSDGSVVRKTGDSYCPRSI